MIATGALVKVPNRHPAHPDVCAKRKFCVPDGRLQDGPQLLLGGHVAVVRNVNDQVYGHLVLTREVPLAADVVFTATVRALAIVAHLDGGDLGAMVDAANVAVAEGLPERALHGVLTQTHRDYLAL